MDRKRALASLKSAALAALLAAVPASAVDYSQPAAGSSPSGGGSAGGMAGGRGAGSEAAPAPAETEAPEAAPRAPELAEARSNFETLVRNYAARKKLSLQSVDKNSLEAAGRPGVFIGSAQLAAADGRPVKARFTVDMSGTEWTVTGHKMEGGPKKKKAAGKKSPAAP